MGEYFGTSTLIFANHILKNKINLSHQLAPTAQQARPARPFEKRALLCIPHFLAISKLIAFVLSDIHKLGFTTARVPKAQIVVLVRGEIYAEFPRQVFWCGEKG